MSKINLPAEVREAGFAIEGNPPLEVGFYGSFGDVDFSKLTVQRANALVNKGFAYLKKVESKTAKAEPKEVTGK